MDIVVFGLNKNMPCLFCVSYDLSLYNKDPSPVCARVPYINVNTSKKGFAFFWVNKQNEKPKPGLKANI